MSESSFSAPPFLHRSGIYEVNIRQYTPEGSFPAFIPHLPRLRDMGVDILWLMPVFPIGHLHRKGELGSYYSISDFQKVNPEFGSREDFSTLIRECHALGIRVIMDWVANHTAHDHIWTQQHPEFYVRDETGAFLSPFDWTDVIQLDHAHGGQQAAMTEAMLYWIREFDIDGFRADLAHLTPLPFWKKVRKAADEIKPGLIWLAETEDPSYHEAFDISFTWKWMHETERVCKGEDPVDRLLSVLQSYQNDFPPEAFRLFFTSNHDENSWNGTEYEKYGEYAKLLSIFSFTYSSLPLVYSGQEIPNKTRLPFFNKQPLTWPEKPLLHDFYKNLFSLRRNSPVLGTNDNSCPVSCFVPEDKVLIFFRQLENDSMMVVFNFSGEIKRFSCPAVTPPGVYEDFFSGEQFRLLPGEVLETERASARVLIKKGP